MKLCAAIFLEQSCIDAAQACADTFEVPCVDGSALDAAKPKLVERLLSELVESVEGQCALVVDGQGWQLIAMGAEYRVSIRADFCGATTTYRRLKGGGKGQMIAKAVGAHTNSKLKVLDATAGLGGDAFVLASLGCEVTMLERHPVVRWLLADGLTQAKHYAEKEDPELGAILQRMHLVEADSFEYLSERSHENAPDVVYVDPMFPVRAKRALVKKEMRVFHALVGEDPDSAKLLPAALEKARYRVVVKRPRIAPFLDQSKPSYELAGKSNRYDIYSLQKIG
ncbi:MAG: class I SAM-dependent methyltransferase [Opitutaceae bacterium]